MATVSYPFDPSGSLASNLIQNEEQTLALSSNGYLFLVPFAGPFFKSSMKVVYYPGAKVLKEGVDYVASHYFKSASLSCAKPIYGSLTFYNKSLAGTVKLQYQTIGGEWVTTKTKALNVIANTLLNPRVAYWEQITDLPYAFPPVEHSWSLDDLVGMSSVVAELKLITNAIRSKSVGGGASTGTGGSTTSNETLEELVSHLLNRSNPHETTAAQIGLSLVQNYGLATESEAKVGYVRTAYMSPYLTKLAIETLAGNALAGHTDSRTNPHQVTKAQVDLGNVPNYSVATTAEALAGTIDTAFMTPSKTKTAVDNAFGGFAFKTYNDTNIVLGNVLPVGFNAANINRNVFADLTTHAHYATVKESLIIGIGSAGELVTANHSVILGNGSVKSATSLNRSVIIGFNAHNSATSVDEAVVIGVNAHLNCAGSGNVVVGFNALSTANTNTTEHCVIVGYEAAKNANGSTGSTIVGYRSALNMTTGDGNVIIGASTALDLTTAGGTVAIGNNIATNNSSFSVAIGQDILISPGVNYATAIGNGAQVTTANTTVLGRNDATVVIGGYGKNASGAKLQVVGKIEATAPDAADSSQLVPTTSWVRTLITALMSDDTGNESTFDKSKYLGLNLPSVLNPRADHPEETGQVVTVVDVINHLFTYASSGKAAIIAAGKRVGLSVNDNMSFHEIAAVIDTITSFSVQVKNAEPSVIVTNIPDPVVNAIAESNQIVQTDGVITAVADTSVSAVPSDVVSTGNTIATITVG